MTVVKSIPRRHSFQLEGMSTPEVMLHQKLKHCASRRKDCILLETHLPSFIVDT